MSYVLLMTYSYKGLLSFCLGLFVLLSPVTYAQTTGDAGTGTEVEKQSCVLPWTEYKNFINDKLAYQSAVADADYAGAQEIFTVMQDSLVNNCDATASIVDVQVEELQPECLALLNHLVAKNNINIREANVESATITQSLIQSILTDTSCDAVIAGDVEQTIEFVQQEISDSQIDPELSVIPYEENACFLEYGPNKTFTEQIQNATTTTLLDTVSATVGGYMDSLLGNVPDETQSVQRESVLLKFANAVIQSEILQRMGGDNAPMDQLFTDQLSTILANLSDTIGAEGLTEFMDWINNDISNTYAYINAVTTLPLRDTYADTQAILDAIRTDTHTLVWNQDTQTFDEITPEQGDRGFSFIFPSEDGNDMDIRFLAIDATVIPVASSGAEQTNKNTSGTTPLTRDEAAWEIQRIILDIHHGDKKIIALDGTATYDPETGDTTAVDLALYAAPYIITNHVDISYDDVLHTNTTSMEIHRYGPAGCDGRIDYINEETPRIVTPESAANPYATTTNDNTSLSLSIGDTTIAMSVTDRKSMIAEIQALRETIPTALSAPNTASYVVEAKLYQNNIYTADIEPDPNNYTRKIRFTDNNTRTKDLVTYYWDPLSLLYPLPLDAFIQLGESIQALILNPTGYKTVAGCTDPEATNYNVRATSDDGSCVIENTGSGETTPDPVLGCTKVDADNYDANATQDDGSCTYTNSGSGDANMGSGDANMGSGETTPDPVLGCTDAGADNYDANATQDDGSCTYAPVLGCTDAGADNYDANATQDDGSCTYAPVLGCTDPEATNYNPLATEEDWTCEY